MWEDQQAYRPEETHDGDHHEGPRELSGAAYFTVLSERVRALQEPVEEFLAQQAHLGADEADRAIREDIVRPHVLTYNRHAEAIGEPRLPGSAQTDLFNRLRQTHGLLTTLFNDPAITNIHIHGPGKPVWVMRSGRLEDVDITLTREEITTYIEKWQQGASGSLTPLNWSIDATQPHARITAIHDHVAVGGPAVSIRLRPPVPFDGPTLVAHGMMPQEVWEYVRLLFVDGAVSMVIGGPMNSGKTTLMQTLLRALPSDCLVVTIENPLELHVGPNVLQLIAHLPMAGDPGRTGEVTTRDLVQRSLRLAVQRIVVGECRGAEALDMLAAMSLGHDGSITTIHANSPLQVLKRLALLCMYAAEDLSQEAIQSTICDAVGLVIVVARTAVGVRVTHVAAIEGVTEGRFVPVSLLAWEGNQLCATGYEVPRSLKDHLAAHGVDLDHLDALLAALPSARPGEVAYGQ